MIKVEEVYNHYINTRVQNQNPDYRWHVLEFAEYYLKQKRPEIEIEILKEACAKCNKMTP